ncbi:MAG: hypothetical protein WCO08_02585 [Actinomycetes bacterium]
MSNFPTPRISMVKVVVALAALAVISTPYLAHAGTGSDTFIGSGIRSHGAPIFTENSEQNGSESSKSGSASPSSSAKESIASGALPSVSADDATSESAWQQAQGAARTGGATAKTVANPISFHTGGVIYSGNVAIYPVWVGTWTSARQALWNSVLSNLVTVLGTSAANSATVNQVFATNQSYFTARGAAAPTLTWPQAAKASAPVAASGNVTDMQVSSYIWTAMNNGAVPLPNATAGLRPIYVYIGANNTYLSSGFGTAYCGWHSYGTFGTTSVPFIAIQDFTSTYLPACATNTTASPNGDAYVDAMASVLVHEIDETLTDPNLNAWYDARGAENADKCAWTFGTTTTASGYKYNITEGGKRYLIQRNWLATNVNKGDGTACTLASAS